MCEGNILIVRVILLILKNLQRFGRSGQFTASLVSVLGPDLCDGFYQKFSEVTGQKAFGDPYFRCKLHPGLQVMSQLRIREDLVFTYSYSDIYGETFVEVLDKINASVDRDVAQ